MNSKFLDTVAILKAQNKEKSKILMDIEFFIRTICIKQSIYNDRRVQECLKKINKALDNK